MARVTHLWRYAVKGLDRDEIDCATLTPGLGLPHDREWALHLVELPVSNDAEEEPVGRFDPEHPEWVHKQCFLGAYTAGELLGALETSFDDRTCTLTVRRRGRKDDSGDDPTGDDGADGNGAGHQKHSGRRRLQQQEEEPAPMLLQERLDTPSGRKAAGDFFSSLPGNDRPVTVVASAIGPHHFGNTPRGFKSAFRPDGDPSGCVLHLVNAATVRALSEAAGITAPPLAPSRFRPNVVLDGLPAWEEFSWVGRRICVGGATLEVLSRTVRCGATNVDARGGSGEADHDVPALLRQHFPMHGPFLGVYARVVRAGDVRPGDKVRVEEEDAVTTTTGGLVLTIAVALLAFAVALLVL